MAYEDPGWGGAFKMVSLSLLFVPVFLRSRRVRARPGLVAMRTLTVALVEAWVLFGVVLAFVGPHRGNSIGLMAGIVIASGIGSFSFVSRARERVLDVSSLQSLATSYRPVFFLGFAVSESTVLLGFVAVFVTGRLWIFALGLIIGIANFARIWPSAANIDFMQRRITDRGSPLSLGEALMLPTDRP